MLTSLCEHLRRAPLELSCVRVPPRPPGVLASRRGVLAFCEAEDREELELAVGGNTRDTAPYL